MKQEFKPAENKKKGVKYYLICIAVYAAIGLFLWMNSKEIPFIDYLLRMTIPTIILIVAVFPWNTQKQSITIDDSSLIYGKTRYERKNMSDPVPYEEKYNNALTGCGVEFFYDEGGKAGKKRISLMYYNEQNRKEIQKTVFDWIQGDLKKRK